MLKRKRRVMSLVMTAAMITTLSAGMSVASFAASAESTPTTITNLSEITNMAGNYKLGADVTIDASSWTPIGTSSAPFTGTFDGNGKTVSWSGSTAGKSYYGIFGDSAGTISNLNVSGSFAVTGSNLDYISPVAGYNSGRIYNVNNAASVTASGSYNVGGITGYNDRYNTGSLGYIYYSSNSGAVTGKSKVGGIVGENAGKVAASSNSGAVTTPGTGKNGVGGIAGRNGNNNTATETGVIFNCYNTGAISAGNGRWGGGIAGFQNSLSTSSNCYSTTKASGYRNVDYIVGNEEGKSPNTVSGSATAETMNRNAHNSATVDASVAVWTDGGNSAVLTNASTGCGIESDTSTAGSTPATKTVYLDAYSGTTGGTGTEADPYHTLSEATTAAGSGGQVVLLNGITINANITLNDSVTYTRGFDLNSSSPAPMFVIDPGDDVYVTMTSATVDGKGIGTDFQVNSGNLRLRGNIKVQNAATAVYVNGGMVTVNKAQIAASGYSVQLANADSNFVLQDFGGTTISGTVYLGRGSYITAGAAIPCSLTVAGGSLSAGSVIAKGTSSYALTSADENSLSVEGQALSLDSGNNQIIVEQTED